MAPLKLRLLLPSLLLLASLEALAQNDWTGYKLTEELDIPIKEQILNTTFQIFHPNSLDTNRSDYKIVDTKKQKTVTSVTKLDSNLKALQIETCRRQNLSKCPVTQLLSSSTAFIQAGNRIHTCRHSFHNWLALATENNPDVGLKQIYPPMILFNYEGKVIFNTAYSTQELTVSVINEASAINKIDTENNLTGNRSIYHNVSDYIQFESSQPLTKSYNYSQIKPMQTVSTFYLSGYPDVTNVYGGPKKGDAPGNKLVTNTGKAREDQLFYQNTTNTGLPGNSGGPVVDSHGNLVGIFCSGEFQKSSIYKIKTEQDFLLLWDKYLNLMTE